MDQVFNELSLSSSLPDNHAAHAALLMLKKASDKLIALGFSSQIRITEDFVNRYITPGCTIHNYLRSAANGEQRTLRQLLLKRFSSAPYIDQLCTYAGMTDLEEYLIGKETCQGLALAFLWSIPSLSLANDTRFIPPYVTMTHYSLDETDEDILEETCQVGLICKEEDIPYHEENIKAQFYIPTTTGNMLLDYAHQHLPYLLFSSVAKKQLMDMQQGYVLLPRIRMILNELQRAMQEAIDTRKPFSPQGFKYTPTESETATQGKNREKHTFTFSTTDEQGNSKKLSLLCESHMRITDGDRIYFYADTDSKIVYVGHIGQHLPCKNYN